MSQRVRYDLATEQQKQQLSTHVHLTIDVYEYLIVVVVAIHITWASLVAQMVRNLTAMQETWVRSLGWEDPLGKGLAINSSVLAQRTSWTERPGGLQSMGSQRIRTQLGD